MYDLLHALVFTFLKDHLGALCCKTLSQFQQLPTCMILIQLRLNLSSQDLAYIFGIPKSTLGCTFLHVTDVMYIRVKPFIIWLERDVLQRTMPMGVGWTLDPVELYRIVGIFCEVNFCG